jgi:lysyl-tRNA synthetase class 2
MNFDKQSMVFEARLDGLRLRSRAIIALRQFFDDLGFIEVQTPILQTMPGADVHIHAFKTEQVGLDLRFTRTMYLHNSPEFAMKKILVAGARQGLNKIYQIVTVFRNGEDSKLHSAEFNVIEWYRTHDSYETIMKDCENLIAHMAQACGVSELSFGQKKCNPCLPFERITVCEAVQKFCGFDLVDCLDDRELLATKARINAVTVRTNDSWDDIFFAIMAQKIEPYLGEGRGTILYEYPAHMAALSRVCDNDKRFAKRFELYICGVELANAFDELTDGAEQRARFINDMQQKEVLYGEAFPIDEEFLSAIDHGLPPTGGIALGVDRLVMLLTGADKIDDVLWWGKV